MMKSMAWAMALMAVAALFAGGNALAQSGTNTSCPNYVDADNNGVCDNYGTECQAGPRRGQGAGVCDGTGRQERQRQGKCNGQGQGQGQGKCKGGRK